ncbi:hypothetical protein AB6A40_001125 [Gnathostoma spinigerum]|uniref:Tyrosinase copper-binding domain-containing protein n=1 Tax=Gnathostoma spinigerum TaxID=75299 RepID=A0ABD6E5N7_9BILA
MYESRFPICLLFLMWCVLSKGVKYYTLKTTSIVNGHKYEESITQPWFRVEHAPHVKLNASVVDDHHAPIGIIRLQVPEEFKNDDPPNKWPQPFADYLHCLDLLCLCPLYNGRTIDGRCRLPNGEWLQKAIRKEYRLLTNEERNRYVSVLNILKTNGIYSQLHKIHKFNGVHSGPAFLPWHREFFKRFEIVLRYYDPNIALPYWDSTIDNHLDDPTQSTMFSKYLLGDTNSDGEVINGPFGHWTTADGRLHISRSFNSVEGGELFNEPRIDFVMNITDVKYILTNSLPTENCANYTLDDRFLEFSHDYVHTFIAGDMFDRFTSGNDPILFLHHSFVDLIWELWRKKAQTRWERENDYPPNNINCSASYHFSDYPMPMQEPFVNKDGLSNKYTDYLYEYAPRPSCTMVDTDCHSEYLFCNTKDEYEPVCVAKVKLGGQCAGFAGQDVCYKGSCVDGYCKLKIDGIMLDQVSPMFPLM